jgi:hypothetical protein
MDFGSITPFVGTPLFGTSVDLSKRRYAKDARPEGWCHGDCVRELAKLVNHKTQVIVDGGCWMGRSASIFCDMAPNATIICIDTWQGSPEHQERYADILPDLFEIFCANMHQHRHRVIPVRMTSVQGLRHIRNIGINPDLIWVDWDHSEASVRVDLSEAMQFDSIVCGDDYTWKGVKVAVDAVDPIQAGPVFWRAK